jgi:hypothetical protein
MTERHRRALILLPSSFGRCVVTGIAGAHGYVRSSNRVTPGAAGFLILSHALLGPDR